MKNVKPVLDHTSAEMKRNKKKQTLFFENFSSCFVNRGRARAVGQEHETIMCLGLDYRCAWNRGQMLLPLQDLRGPLEKWITSFFRCGDENT